MGQFERIKYPDGQIGAKWVEESGELPWPSNPLKVRINSYEDLFYVRSVADILHYHSIKGWELLIPCMFGQRSDRRFSQFQSFDLKLITDIVNECEFDQIHIFDPHSDVCMALINNSVKVSSLEYVHRAMLEIIAGDVRELTLVAPDAGAYKKVFEYGEKLSLPVVGGLKHRDEYGNVELTFSADVTGKDCLIVDDLCDGGYTFLILADKLRQKGARKVYLYVSHGLFSKGFTKLYENIDHIYCTNSVKDLEQDTKPLAPGRDPGLWVYTKDFVTQYKII